MSRYVFLKLVLLLLCGLCARDVLACSYGAITVCEKYQLSDLVLVGKIESVQSLPYEQTVVVGVEKTFKGRPLDQIVLNQERSTCDPDFSDNVGQIRLFYIVRNRKTKKYSALIPGTGGQVEQMNEELYWLNNLPTSLKRTRIAGTVQLYTGTVLAPGRLENPYRFVKNVAGIKVKVFNDKNSSELVTDKNGVYELWDIPRGKYQIQAVLPPDLIPDLEMEKGALDYDTLRKKDPETRSVLIEITGNDCGGIDFVVNQKPNK